MEKLNTFFQKSILNFIIFLVCFYPAILNSEPFNFNDTPWNSVGQEYGIDPHLLYSIALIESMSLWSDGKVRPWRWALNVDGKPYYPKTREEALNIILKNISSASNIDVGAMQVSIRYHKDKIQCPLDLLDIENNIRVGAQILRIAMDSTDDPIIGIGRYHSWSNSKAKEYGRKVFLLADMLKAKEEIR
jgi:soluble lytic murein transglycosylase-like protein